MQIDSDEHVLAAFLANEAFRQRVQQYVADILQVAAKNYDYKQKGKRAVSPTSKCNARGQQEHYAACTADLNSHYHAIRLGQHEFNYHNADVTIRALYSALVHATQRRVPLCVSGCSN